MRKKQERIIEPRGFTMEGSAEKASFPIQEHLEGVAAAYLQDFADTKEKFTKRGK